MTAEIFVDTSGWFPLVDPSDPHHAAVSQTVRKQVAHGVRLVTTNLIVAETYVLLLRRADRNTALAFLEQVDRRPNLVIRSTEDLERRAEHQWLRRFQDQAFSLSDAVSFAVMKERGIQTALTLDRHFATAGFQILPHRPNSIAGRAREPLPTYGEGGSVPDVDLDDSAALLDAMDEDA